MKFNIKSLLIITILLFSLCAVTSCEKYDKVTVAGVYVGKISISGMGTIDNSQVIIQGPVLGKGVVTLKSFPLLSGEDLIIPLVNITKTEGKYSLDYKGNLLPGIASEIKGTGDGYDLTMTIKLDVSGAPMMVSFTGRK